jgi:hypothetical protein
LNSIIEHWEVRMPELQIRLGIFSKDYNALTKEKRDFLDYFIMIRSSCIEPLIERYYHSGPKGYGTALILTRVLKIKERISSDRELASKLKKNEIYRIACQLNSDDIPSHNSYNTLRNKLGTDGYVELHKNFVYEANKLGLLTPHINGFPDNMRDGIILIADSAFILTSSSTKGTKTEEGKWLFTDKDAAFGRRHHKHKYPVGYRAHSLITINGIPLVSIIAKANEHDIDYIIPLLEALFERYQNLKFIYIILDKGYDSEEVHGSIYEDFGIIPVIIRKKMVYPKGFTDDGFPLCPFGFPMRRKGIEYQYKRTKYACYKKCFFEKQEELFLCNYRDNTSFFGYTTYTYFEDSYRKFGPALPSSNIYKRLKPYRTGIERNYAIVKENRYRMEAHNTYTGMNNVQIHVIEHDIVLTQDIIYDFLTSGKTSSIIKT